MGQEGQLGGTGGARKLVSNSLKVDRTTFLQCFERERGGMVVNYVRQSLRKLWRCVVGAVFLGLEVIIRQQNVVEPVGLLWESGSDQICVHTL